MVQNVGFHLTVKLVMQTIDRAFNEMENNVTNIINIEEKALTHKKDGCNFQRDKMNISIRCQVFIFSSFYLIEI